MPDSGLTIVVPVYNEAQAIERSIADLIAIKQNAEFDVEVVLVDDGSEDGTQEVLLRHADVGFRMIRHTENRGYGASLKSGLDVAQHRYVAITDADGTYPNHRIVEFYEKAVQEDLDMVVGARTGGAVHIPFIRRPAKWALNQLANYLTRKRIPDLNSGLRVMRKDAVREFLGILPDGFSFTTTITLALLTNNRSVSFVPINYQHREGKSKIRPIYDTLNFIQLILRTVLYFDPLRVFLPASFALITVSLMWGLFSWVVLGLFADASSLLLFLSGIQLGAIGLLADLINRRTAPATATGRPQA
jgi:glycosyltransferase involved in cell wall biosynthesis